MEAATSEFNILNSINYPADLRKLKVEQLPALCRELRDDILKELSVNPGHMASSMGTIELTVALHYVFNTPDDRLVWDVGHQARRLRASMTRSYADTRQTPYRRRSAWPWPTSARDTLKGMSWP